MYIDIVKYLDCHGMSRYELAKKIDTTYPTIDKIYKHKTASISFDVLEKICEVLDCTPNDILINGEYKGDRK